MTFESEILKEGIAGVLVSEVDNALHSVLAQPGIAGSSGPAGAGENALINDPIPRDRGALQRPR